MKLTEWRMKLIPGVQAKHNVVRLAGGTGKKLRTMLVSDKSLHSIYLFIYYYKYTNHDKRVIKQLKK